MEMHFTLAFFYPLFLTVADCEKAVHVITQALSRTYLTLSQAFQMLKKPGC